MTPPPPPPLAPLEGREHAGSNASISPRATLGHTSCVLPRRPNSPRGCLLAMRTMCQTHNLMPHHAICVLLIVIPSHPSKLSLDYSQSSSRYSQLFLHHYLYFNHHCSDGRLSIWPRQNKFEPSRDVPDLGFKNQREIKIPTSWLGNRVSGPAAARS